MTGAQRLITAREQLIDAALTVLASERRLSAARAVPVVLRAEENLYLAARNVTRAVEELEPVKRPKGWEAA